MAAVRVAGDNQAAIPLPADILQLLGRKRRRDERLGLGQQSAHGPERATLPDSTHLAAEEVTEHSAAPKVPDDDKASAVANEDLVGVSRVLLQSLHHLKHSPVAGFLWQPRQGSAVSPWNSGDLTFQPGRMLGLAWDWLYHSEGHAEQDMVFIY